MKSLGPMLAILFVCVHNSDSTAPTKEIGKKIVEHYSSLPDSKKKPGGDCYVVAYERINKVVKAECGKSLPDLKAFKAFDRLWASKIDPKTSWKKLDEKFRGKGAAGAMSSMGMGDLVAKKEILEGKLKPGAVLQTWKKNSDYTNVKNGDKPESIGHSFIFLKYVKDSSGKITGMKIADQGTSWAEPKTLNIAEFEYWVGANLKCP